ncbi:hypothetical protein NDU88_004340 [Pleurodeles waltl]|uniref:Uncharacterized protein n=1 Tax=Pleurodeles waltl TaxID=8319 RepID=A0AAV7T938_PLEWA|nr:hypothetical protein NDU88_004340 [Pleurodeles waltl]
MDLCMSHECVQKVGSGLRWARPSSQYRFNICEHASMRDFQSQKTTRRQGDGARHFPAHFKSTVEPLRCGTLLPPRKGLPVPEDHEEARGWGQAFPYTLQKRCSTPASWDAAAATKGTSSPRRPQGGQGARPGISLCASKALLNPCDAGRCCCHERDFQSQKSTRRPGSGARHFPARFKSADEPPHRGMLLPPRKGLPVPEEHKEAREWGQAFPCAFKSVVEPLRRGTLLQPRKGLPVPEEHEEAREWGQAFPCALQKCC